MSELPEYQRQNRIQPAAGGSEFSKATRGLADSYQSVSNLGAQIAQNSANELARLRGLEAGKTPGQKLLPAFTESDKHFVDAYRQQEQAIAYNQGVDLLRALSFEATRNPTNSSLLEYEQTAREGLDEILQNLTPGNEESLRKVFDDAYSSNFYQIAQTVENQNNKILQQNTTRFLNEGLKQVQDLRANDDNKGAEALKAKINDWVKNRGGDLIMTTPEGLDYIDTLQKADETAEASRDINRAIIMGVGEQALAEQVRKPMTDKNIRQTEAMFNAYKQRMALQSMQDDVLYQESMRQIEQGEMGPAGIIELQHQMTLPTFTKFRREAERFFAKEGAKQRDFQFIEANRDQPFKLASVSAETRNAFLDFATKTKIKMANDQGIPLEDNMHTRAMVASGYTMDFPDLTAGIQAAVKSGIPAQMDDAGRALHFLAQRNSSSISKMDGKVVDAALDFNALVRNHVNPEKAAEMAMKKLDPMPDTRYAELTTQLGQVQKDYTNHDVIKDKVSDLMGWSKGAIPPGVLNDFRRVFENYFLETGNTDVAKLKTKSYMGATYGESNFNGYKEVVFSPIDKAYPDSYHWLRQQFIDKCESVFTEKRNALETNRSIDGVYFEFDQSVYDVPFRHNEKQPGHMGIKLPILGAKPMEIKGRKILADGGHQQGIFIIEADEATVTPEDGRPSWAISFRRDNEARAYPIRDPRTGEKVRFMPDHKRAAEDQITVEKLEHEWRMKVKKELYTDKGKDLQSATQFLQERGLVSE